MAEKKEQTAAPIPAPADSAEKKEPEGPPIPDPTQVREITPENSRFEETPGRMLDVTVDGDLYERVQVHASFPHTDPSHYISIRTSENKEVGMIRDLAAFSQEQAALIDWQMKVRYFAPEIVHIVSVKEEFGYTYVVAETTAGECRFTFRGSGGIIHPTENKYLITDVDGNRFVIPDVTKLPPRDYKLIDIYL